jgi:membrane protein
MPLMTESPADSDPRVAAPPSGRWLAALAASAVAGGWWLARRRPRAAKPAAPAMPSRAAVENEQTEAAAEKTSTGLQVVGSLVAPALTALAQAQVRKALVAAQHSAEQNAQGFVPLRRDSTPRQQEFREATFAHGSPRPASLSTQEDCLPDTALPTTDASLWGMLKRTVLDWLADDCPRLGAALAFYTLFSLAPTLILVTALASAVFGPEAVQGKIDSQVESLIGDEGAEAVRMIVVSARESHGGTTATVLGVATLLLGATAVFGELKSALNQIWHAQKPKGSSLWQLVHTRLLSFAVVLIIGALLLGSVILSTVISNLETLAAGVVPVDQVWLVKTGNLALSLVVFTLLFALIFRILPDRFIAWSDVWLGAAVTAGLFTLGKHLIGLYLAHASVSSTYGAAGSVAVLLLWTYYSAQILFLGAEFTKVVAFRPGSATLQRQAKPQANVVRRFA